MDERLAIDTGVLVLYFVVIISIGLYMGRKEENLADFALGRRQIAWWAILASLIAAETSAGTFFGTPGEGFTFRNYTYLQLALGTILARILVSYIFIKPYYDHKVYSIYEYLTARFGVPTKNAASAVFLFTRLLASGARLYVAAIALALGYEMVRGVRPGQTETLFIYIGAIVAIVLLTAIYTTLGGIKAVIWTDVIQASIMIGSAVVAVGLLYFSIPGGWHEIVQRHGGFHVSDFITTGLNPAKSGWDKIKGMFAIEYTIFAGLIGSTFMTMSTHGTGPGHGAADVDRAGCAAQQALSHHVRSSRYTDRVHISQYRGSALGFLSNASRSEFAENAERNFLPLHSLRNAGRHSWIAACGNIRDCDGLAQHCVERARHEFHSRLVRALHQSEFDRRTKSACSPLGHSLVLDFDDRCCSNHGISRDRLSERPDHSDRSGNLRLHLRLSAGNFPCGYADQVARQ